jgi:hypothetical protein
MWIFSRNGFISLAMHPQEADKLVVQTQTSEEMDRIVLLLDELGSKHEIERVMDGFCRFATVAHKDVAAQLIARLVVGIDYSRFTQAVNFDFGTDPQFLLWMNTNGLQVARVSPE